MKLPSSNKELLHVPGQALGRGNSNRAGPASEELPTLEEKDSRICIHRTYSSNYNMKSALQKKKGSRVPSTCIHGHKPVSQLPASSPLRFFFSDAGLSLWSKQRLFILRKGNHKVLLIYARTRLPCLAVSVGAKSDFIIRGAHWGTYRTRQAD